MVAVRNTVAKTGSILDRGEAAEYRMVPTVEAVPSMAEAGAAVHTPEAMEAAAH